MQRNLNEHQPSQGRRQSVVTIIEKLNAITSNVRTKTMVASLFCIAAYVNYTYSSDNQKIIEKILLDNAQLLLLAGYGLTCSLEDLTFIMKELISQTARPKQESEKLEFALRGSRLLLGTTLCGLGARIGSIFNVGIARHITAFSAIFSLYATSDVVKSLGCSLPREENNAGHLHLA